MSIDKAKLLARLEEIKARDYAGDSDCDFIWQDVISDLMDEVEGWAAPHRKLDTTLRKAIEQAVDAPWEAAEGDPRAHLVDTIMAAVEAHIDTLTAAMNEVLEDLAYGKPADESRRILAAILRGEQSSAMYAKDVPPDRPLRD